MCVCARAHVRVHARVPLGRWHYRKDFVEHLGQLGDHRYENKI